MSTAIQPVKDLALIESAMLALNPPTGIDEEDLIDLSDFDDGSMGYEFQPLRIKVPSGGTQAFEVNGEYIKLLKTVIIMSQKNRVLFATEDKDTRPICSSTDGVVGIFDPDVDNEQFENLARQPSYKQHPGVAGGAGNYECATCPLAQFGSSLKGGGGQACGLRYRQLWLVEGIEGPVIISLPATSAGMYDRYASKLRQAQRSTPAMVWTDVALTAETNKRGDEYSRVAFTMSEKIDRSDLSAVKVLRDGLHGHVRTMEITLEDFDTNGNGSTDTADVEF